MFVCDNNNNYNYNYNYKEKQNKLRGKYETKINKEFKTKSDIYF